MDPYTKLEILQMRAAFSTIEAMYIPLDEASFSPETKEHRRLNGILVKELEKEEPDHEKIFYLLNAINNVQNGKPQTTKTEPPKEEPKSDPAKGLKRWIKKINKKRD